ncbi:hypothetical protein EXIGLDRAFT_396387 [Exidia glandulosa HHB12029]|uniref:Uncharacterized protein n=1 Tax=Exidia glandulosa HHB12029 TaxID=1314781 RepID=A0A166B0V5_EXIGL|nr:hypothetical protein EXIGLDRAFT_396387 [Exidia glandulosa HHB12029]
MSWTTSTTTTPRRQSPRASAPRLASSLAASPPPCCSFYLHCHCGSRVSSTNMSWAIMANFSSSSRMGPNRTRGSYSSRLWPAQRPPRSPTCTVITMVIRTSTWMHSGSGPVTIPLDVHLWTFEAAAAMSFLVLVNPTTLQGPNRQAVLPVHGISGAHIFHNCYDRRPGESTACLLRFSSWRLDFFFFHLLCSLVHCVSHMMYSVHAFSSRYFLRLRGSDSSAVY